MANEGIGFQTSGGEGIYSPLLIESNSLEDGSSEITVINFGTGDEEDYPNIGLWISPSSNVGDVDNPADRPPAGDYQDLLTWGTETVATADPALMKGGLKVYKYDIDAGDYEVDPTYVTRAAGSNFGNRIILGNLESSSSMKVKIELEPRTDIDARRFFVSVNVDYQAV